MKTGSELNPLVYIGTSNTCLWGSQPFIYVMLQMNWFYSVTMKSIKKFGRWESCFLTLNSDLFPSDSQNIIRLLTYIHPRFCLSYWAAAICTTSFMLHKPTQTSSGMDDCFFTAQMVSLSVSAVREGSQQPPGRAARKWGKFYIFSNLCSVTVRIKHLEVALKSADLTLCRYVLHLHLNRSKSTKFFKKRKQKSNGSLCPNFTRKSRGKIK